MKENAQKIVNQIAFWQDTAIELPCRVGDIVWYIHDHKYASTIECFEVAKIEIYSDNLIYLVGFDFRTKKPYTELRFYEGDTFITKELAQIELNKIKQLQELNLMDVDFMTKRKMMSQIVFECTEKQHKIKNELTRTKKFALDAKIKELYS